MLQCNYGIIFYGDCSMKRISVEVEEKFHRQVKIKAAQDGVRIADVVRDLLKGWLAPKEKTGPVKLAK